MENEILLNEIQPIKGRLRVTMANTLHNGNLQLSIRLTKAEEIKPRLTPRESLMNLKANNASLKKLVDVLGLTLT